MLKLEEGAGVTAWAPGPCLRKTQACSKPRARGDDYFACPKAQEQVSGNTNSDFAGTDCFWEPVPSFSSVAVLEG